MFSKQKWKKIVHTEPNLALLGTQMRYKIIFKITST